MVTETITFEISTNGEECSEDCEYLHERDGYCKLFQDSLTLQEDYLVTYVRLHECLDAKTYE